MARSYHLSSIIPYLHPNHPKRLHSGPFIPPTEAQNQHLLNTIAIICILHCPQNAGQHPTHHLSCFVWNSIMCNHTNRIKKKHNSTKFWFKFFFNAYQGLLFSHCHDFPWKFFNDTIKSTLTSKFVRRATKDNNMLMISSSFFCVSQAKIGISQIYSLFKVRPLA